MSHIDTVSRRDPNDRINLCDLLDRLLDTGVVVQGSIILSVAGIDLVYVEISLLAGSVDKIMGNHQAIGGRA
ncbi:MAG: gas vesicle protein GvpJ [Devosia sp.]